MERDLQRLNEQNKLALWAERVSECRNSGLSVLAWCKENGVCTQTYYKWQKRLFAMAKVQQETQFAEVTPVPAMQPNSLIAVTVRSAGIAVDIHNGAIPETVKDVLQLLKSC